MYRYAAMPRASSLSHKRISLLLNAIALLIFISSAQSALAATFTVTSLAHAGAGTLRQAVLDANDTATDDTIVFNIPAALCPADVCTVSLDSEIAFANNGSLTIQGTGANRLTIYGGADANRIFLSNGATFTLSGMTLTGGNGSAGANGGAMLVIGGAATIRGVYFKANTGASNGGGVSFEGGNHFVENCAFSGNIVTVDGGAIYSQSASLAVYNSTFSGNSAVGTGGAISAPSFGSLVLRYNTITGNTAGHGGGLSRALSTVSLKNNIIAGNTGNSSAPEIFLNTVQVFSEGYNLIGDSAGDSSSTASPVTYATTDIRDTPPRLDPLGDYGGTIPTMRLQLTRNPATTSPAIDKGGLVAGITTDARGVLRPFDTYVTSASDGNNSDIGAFERTYSLTPFDFDADGKSDISIFRPSNGEWWVQTSLNGGNFAERFGVSSDKLAPADFTGDGKTDIAVFRPSTGEWFILRSDNGSYYSFPFGTSGDIPVPADYDADGLADAAVFRPSNSTWYIFRSTGGTTIQTFGQSGDVPVTADYDGDRRSDIAIFRPSVGEWWIYKSFTGSNAAFQFGNGSDKPVQGDYTGDGKADVAFWRSSTGEWFVLRSEEVSYFSFPFGTKGDIPSPGDYDGDGRFDAAVFRPSASTWYIERTTSGTLIQTFGQSGDKPVPNAFVP